MLMRFARIGLIALLSGLLVIVLAGCIERMFFYPDSATYATPAQLGVRAEDVQIVTADGSRLHGWFLPAAGNAKGTVLHLHGNAANVSNHLPLVSWLPARGYNVLMVDYRGFGRSQGRPSLDGIVDDAAAALAHLRTRPDVDASELIVLGQSIGGATALRLLARDSIIPAMNSEKLHAAASGSQHWSVPDAMHIMALSQPGSWREKLVQAMDAAVR